MVLSAVFQAAWLHQNRLQMKIFHSYSRRPGPPSWISQYCSWSVAYIRTYTRRRIYDRGGFQSKMADSNKNRKILFVCLGNICRSPSAEAIFRHLVQERDDRNQWEIDSAGILDLHEGLRSDKRGLQVLKKHGIVNNHRARQVHEDDFRRFDVILAFDDSNVRDLNETFKPTDGTARAEVKLFGTYDPKGELIIHDPYYGDISDFEVMFDHVYRCCVEFLRQYQRRN